MTSYLDASILAETCSRCPAQPGEKCTTPDGNPASGFHSSRLRAAKASREACAAGQVPVVRHPDPV